MSIYNLRVHRERQWPLSGVHYTMRVKSAQAGEGGGGVNAQAPFTISTTFGPKRGMETLACRRGSGGGANSDEGTDTLVL